MLYIYHYATIDGIRDSIYISKEKQKISDLAPKDMYFVSETEVENLPNDFPINYWFNKVKVL